MTENECDMTGVIALERTKVDPTDGSTVDAPKVVQGPDGIRTAIVNDALENHPV